MEEALQATASLISKSEKVQQKLTQGAWKHTMFDGNLKALHIALPLLTEEYTDQHSKSMIYKKNTSDIELLIPMLEGKDISAAYKALQELEQISDEMVLLTIVLIH